MRARRSLIVLVAGIALLGMGAVSASAAKSSPALSFGFGPWYPPVTTTPKFHAPIRTSAPTTTAPTTTTRPPTTTTAPSTSSTAPPGTTSVPSSVVPFGVSPWYQALPAVTPMAPEGYAYGEEIAAEITQYYQHAALNTTNYAPAYYLASPTQPTMPITMWDCQHKGKLDPNFTAQLANVPLAPTAAIPGDSDAHVVVWQPSTDTVWETWKTRIINGQWQACWGGRLDHASHTTGTFPFPYGATATGISTLAGLITVDELRAGHIDHAISLGVVNTRNQLFSWPANRTDGKNTAPTSIPEGQHLRLDPTIDLTTLHLTPIGRMIAQALQRYGAIIRDTTGAVSIYAQSSITYTRAGQPDPYTTLYAGKPKYAQLDGIPWNHLQALPLNYQQPT